jgi:hypothetical protein
LVFGGFVPFAPPALRRLALAVAVLYDVDLVPQDGGVVLTGSHDIRVSWATLSDVVERADQARWAAGEDPTDRSRHEALAAWLVARCAVDDVQSDPGLVALGIPAGDVNHPGPAWVRETIPGDALCLGFGYGEAFTEPKPVPPGVLEHAGIDVDAAWTRVRAELERLGSLAAERERRQLRRAIVPFGGADVVTLLGSASLRQELVALEGDGGMIGLIVPLRTRGWRATYVSDPAFGPALAAAMPEMERGFARPLLITAEEISEVRAGGDPSRLLRGEEN